jgi:hypothetical protein
MSNIIHAARQMQLSQEARVRLDPGMAPRDAVQSLIDAGQAQDALKLLARLLPTRYAVAWLCQCARSQQLPAEDVVGVLLAEAWVREPNEEHRRAALDYATATGYRSIGTWLAVAVAWSGGNLAPLGSQTTVPPAEHLTASAAVATINLLAALVIEQFIARRETFMRDALGLLATAAEQTGA